MIYAKVGAVLALIAVLFGAGYHVGGMASKTALEAQHAAQLSAVATAYQNQVLAAEADHAHLQGVIDAYDATKDVPDPASMGTAHRVLLVAASTCGSELPQAGAVAGGAPGPAGVAGGPGAVEQALDDYIQAAGRDVHKLIAAQALAPR